MARSFARRSCALFAGSCVVFLACGSADVPTTGSNAPASSVGGAVAAPAPAAPKPPAAVGGGGTAAPSMPPREAVAAAGMPAPAPPMAGAAAGAGGAGQLTAAGSAASGAGGGGGAAGAAAMSGDALPFAKDLSELFIDVPCTTDTPTPLAKGATCQHPPNTQHIEKPAKFGGMAGKVYLLTLRVRGIWEPTYITGGEHPNKEQPFTIGGKVMGGSGSSSDAINYQQYSLQVSEPMQTYWLNDYQYVAHDIHKEDYQISIKVAGGANIKVIMNDGNDHEIANWTQDLFADLPPHDKMPSLGQSLRLDVVSVLAQ